MPGVYTPGHDPATRQAFAAPLTPTLPPRRFGRKTVAMRHEASIVWGSPDR